jgi:hypothetical protein
MLKRTLLSLAVLALGLSSACESSKKSQLGASGGASAGGGGRGGGTTAAGGSGPSGGLGGTAVGGAGGVGAGGAPNGGNGPGGAGYAGTVGNPGGPGGAGGGVGGNPGTGGGIPADCPPFFQSGGTVAGPISGTGQLLLADLNADGKLDLISADNAGITVFSNDGAGHFTSHGSYAVTSMTTFAVATGDLNGDGLADLAIAYDVPPIPNDPPQLGVFLNKGDGTFSPRVQYALPVAGAGVAIGDLDGDHRADVAVSGGSSAYALTNLGNGQLAVPVKLDAGSSLLSIILAGPIAIADLDGDGKLDLLVDEFDSVGTWINQGGLVFSPANVGIGSPGGFDINLDSFIATDLNHDGSPDLVAVGRFPMVDLGQGHAGFALNDGHGHFAASAVDPAILRNDQYAFRIVTGDVNDDARMDFAVAANVTATAGTITTFMAQADGTFQSTSCPAPILANAGFVAGDLNGDGKADLAFHTDGGIGLRMSVGP